ELRRRGAIVRDTGHRRELLGPGRGAERRHLRLLIPGEQIAGAVEVGDLTEAPQKLFEGGLETPHLRGHYPCCRLFSPELTRTAGKVERKTACLRAPRRGGSRGRRVASSTGRPSCGLWGVRASPTTPGATRLSGVRVALRRRGSSPGWTRTNNP